MKKTILFLSLFFFLVTVAGFGQVNSNHDFSLNSKLPVDPNLRTGTLPNGMRYYIRKNAKPEHRAELRLAVHAGSVLESDHQQGLAHLVEHMCFNGTKNFSKSGIVDYLESIGIRFGADLNAYTSYDETVYMLQVPTDTPKFMKQGLQILEDWAHNVSFEDKEIDKERGVVIEEWRLGRGAFDRMGRKIDPVVYNHSKYADRSPIGKKDIIQNAPYDTLKKFYHDWYRPDLQAIVVVGDFDVDQMEKMIIAQFSGIPEPKNPRPRTVYTIQPHKGTVAAVATDKECQYVILRSQFLHDKLPNGTVKSYRDHIKQQLFSQLISSRLNELMHKASPPFTYAYAYIGSNLGETSVYGTFAIAPDNNISGSLKAMITENERIKRFGFTESELERAKKSYLQQVESSYKEREKTDSKALTNECVGNFLEGEDIMGISNEYDYNVHFVPEISLAEINEMSKEWITDDNNDIIVEAPEKDGIQVPKEADIAAMVNASKSEKIEPYNDVSTNRKLLEKNPVAGKVVKETTNKETGTTEWILSNGARVVLKPTEFKDDEIQFGAFSPGGTSLVKDKDFVTCSNAAGIIDQSGIGDFDANTLTKILAGKNVGVSPYITDLYERFYGSASPADVETMLQLLYLYFTDPRIDNDGFESYKTRIKSFVENHTLSPEGVLRDSNQVITSNHNFRQRPASVAILNEIQEARVMDLYKERFGNAGNFTFFFVGNVKPEILKPLVETYIGGLVSNGKKENWKDPKYTFPKGVVKKIVYKGTEPKSYVLLTMKGKFKWTLKNKVDEEAMMKVLNIMLRETMREDKSGVYGVGASLTPVRYPNEAYTISIQFGCAPDNVDMLIQTAFEQVQKLEKEGPSTQNIEKAKETMHRTREVQLKDNNFWTSILQAYYMNNDDISDIMKYDAMVDKITADDIKNAASKYFDFNNYVQVVLMPEK